MIHRLIVSISLVCSGLVLASFVVFARDQLAGASKHQQPEIVAGQQVTPELAGGGRDLGGGGRRPGGARGGPG